MADTMPYHHHHAPSGGSGDHSSHPSLPSLSALSALPHTSYHMPTNYGGNSSHDTQSGAPQQQDNDAGETSAGAAEKRRSKLGYHRTSVACGHCRRRKIRCIPSHGDSQGRCINCIRLKKDCTFYPVDQPPPESRKIRSATMAPLLKSPYSPDKIGRHAFDYPNAGWASWMSADSGSYSAKPVDSAWRYPEAPITPSLAPYTTPPAGPWTPQPDFTGPRIGDDIWSYQQQQQQQQHQQQQHQLPPRSLSYSSETMSSGGGATAYHAGQPSYPSISQMTRGAHHSSGSISANGSGSSYERDHLYQPPSSTAAATAASTAASTAALIATTIPGVDSIATTLDHHVSPSAGLAYPAWPSPYAYGKDPVDAYVNWGDPTSPAGEPHAAMYYTR